MKILEHVVKQCIHIKRMCKKKIKVNLLVDKQLQLLCVSEIESREGVKINDDVS